MVKAVESLSDFEQEIRYKGLVVVDFFAEWCGPCRKVAPFIDSLSLKYPDVKFVKVDVDNNPDIAAPRGISAMPTFHFIVNGNKVDELVGGDPFKIEQKVTQYMVKINPFNGSEGHKLSSDHDPAVPQLSAREARLKAFSSVEGPRKQVPPSETEEKDGTVDEALSKAMNWSMAPTSTTSTSVPPSNTISTQQAQQEAADQAEAEAELDALEKAEAAKVPEHFTATPDQEWEEEMVPVPVNEDLLAQLLDMGFEDTRARKGLVHGTTLEGALGWLDQHQDDADIDQPYLVKKSDTIPKPPLTEEERAERVQAMKDKVKQRRDAAARQEKADAIRREKERRERGQKMEQTTEERQRMQRKRDAERIRKEKEDEKKERARLKAEIARDKELRRANKGMLPSVLGVDGYNPSIIQYDVPANSTNTTPAAPSSTNSDEKTTATAPAVTNPAPVTTATNTVKKSSTTKKAVSSGNSNTTNNSQSPSQCVDTSIETIMRYRAGGDGGEALKLLITFVRNVVEHPEEQKYRSINTEGNAFRGKLAPLVGPTALLKAVGFQKGPEGSGDEGKLKLENMEPALLQDTLQKLVNASTLYKQRNMM